MVHLRFPSTPVATPRSRPRFPGFPLAALLALASACGGSQASAPPAQVVAPPPPPPPKPVHERGRDKLIIEVGPAGGTLELAGGARVEIPAGALQEPVSITFAEGQHTTAFDNREYEKPLGRTLDLTPELHTAAPVVVSIPLPALPEGFEAEDLTLATEVLASHQRGYQDHATQTRWDYNQAQHENGRAQAALTHVPGMRLQFLVSAGD